MVLKKIKWNINFFADDFDVINKWAHQWDMCNKMDMGDKIFEKTQSCLLLYNYLNEGSFNILFV